MIDTKMCNYFLYSLAIFQIEFVLSNSKNYTRNIINYIIFPDLWVGKVGRIIQNCGYAETLTRCCYSNSAITITNPFASKLILFFYLKIVVNLRYKKLQNKGFSEFHSMDNQRVSEYLKTPKSTRVIEGRAKDIQGIQRYQQVNI